MTVSTAKYARRIWVNRLMMTLSVFAGPSVFRTDCHLAELSGAVLQASTRGSS